MMPYKLRFFAPLFAAFLLTQGCDSTSQVPAASTPAPAPINENGVTVIVATSAQCPNGGVVVESFTDLNHDGTLDSGDPVLSVTPVCDGASGASGTNGSNGSNGLGAGIQVLQASTNLCPAGGVKITTFIDINNNGILASTDTVTSTNTVCNGVSGTNGTNGNSFSISQGAATSNQCPNGGVVYTVNEQDGDGSTVSGSSSTSVVCNGSVGTGVVFTTVPATAEQCSSGGNVLLMASDTAETGTYSDTDSNQQSVLICNGSTGAQGPAGPVSSFSSIVPIEACTAASSPWKEVLLCLGDGNILADFSDNSSGANTRLSFISPGSYEDTDDSGCTFSVSSDGAGGSTISWDAGSNAYATWGAGSYDCLATTSP